MRVKELILQLELFPPNTPVIAYSRKDQFLVEDVISRLVETNSEKGTEEREYAVLLLGFFGKRTDK